MQNIYWFDIFIFGITLILGLRGIVNGLIREFFGLIGIIGGILIASHYAKAAALFIQDKLVSIQNQDLAVFAGFLVLLIIIWCLCLLVGSIIRKLVSFSFSFLDRLGGFILGSVKVFLILAILIFCLSRIDFLNQKLQQYTQGSYVLAVLEKTGAFIMNQPYIQEGIKDLDNSFDSKPKE